MNEELHQTIRRVAAEHDGAFYLYETELIREQCRKFLDIPYEDKAIYFATMANANHEFLALVQEMGFGVFINSLGHLERARETGFDGKQLMFTASAMDERSMRRVHEVGALLNLDSRGQLDTWWRLFPGAPVGIRCNIGDMVTPRETRGGYFVGPESRLGLSIDEIHALKGAEHIDGLHLYLGTDIHDLEYYVDCYRATVELAGLFPALRYLDFGGGFGVTTAEGETFDFDRYYRHVSRLMRNVSHQAGHPLRLILEPGRIIGAEAGYFVCRVTDVKIRGARQLVGVNGSAAQFTRPLMYADDAFHPVHVLPAEGSGGGLTPRPTWVYGCSTYSRDFLCRNQLLPDVQVGDLVIFSHAGSYCASSHTTFLGFPPAPEVFV